MKFNSRDVVPVSCLALFLGFITIVSSNAVIHNNYSSVDSMVLQQYHNKQVRKMREQRNAESSLDAIFQKYDSNKDGVLDRKELESYISNRK
jgi:hypothetical protein